MGNIALVHSFARAEAEVSGLRHVMNKLLAAQIPVLSWWALVSVLTRAANTITILAVVIVGAWLNFQGLASVGQIVTFMSFAGLLIPGVLALSSSLSSRLAVSSRSTC